MDRKTKKLTRGALVLTVCVAGASSVAGPAWAQRPNTLSENRGHEACLQSAEEHTRGVTFDPTFFTNTYAQSRHFYMNGYASLEGAWQPVRVACETNRIGSRVLGFRLEPGRFAARFPASVAQTNANP